METKNGYFQRLNERFDNRVLQLTARGYKYFKEYTCFAKSEKGASIGNGIPNGTIMHCEEIVWNYLLTGNWEEVK